MINGLRVERIVRSEAPAHLTNAFGVWRSENAEPPMLAFDARAASEDGNDIPKDNPVARWRDGRDAS